MPRDPFVAQIAETCKNVFEAENTDPNAEEIAFALYKAELPPRWVEDVRDVLLRARDVLEEDGLVITPMSPNYYKEGLRELEEIDDDQARRCIPLGHGVRTEGLRLHRKTDKDDRIWRAWNLQSIKSGNGKVRKSEEKVLTLFKKRKLTGACAAAILNISHSLRQPENPELRQRVMEFLPPEGGA